MGTQGYMALSQCFHQNQESLDRHPKATLFPSLLSSGLPLAALRVSQEISVFCWELGLDKRSLSLPHWL